MQRLLIILFSLALFSCKKSNKEADGVSMQVLEFNTTSGLSNVKIEMYTCSDYDFIFGCRTISKFQTAYTDVNGNYKFQGNELLKSNRGIVLSKEKYWKGEGGVGPRYLVPEGWINLRLLKQNIYADSALFSYILKMNGFSTEMIYLGRLGADTTIRVTAFGDQENTFELHSIQRVPCNWPIGSNCDISLSSSQVTQRVVKFQEVSATFNY